MPAHYFIAIPLPHALKDCFFSWQEELKNELPYKQWTNKHDLHITLKFLGPVERDKLSHLQTALKQIKTFDSFSLKTGNTGMFGSPAKPRVLWAGVEKTNMLASLHKQIEVITEELGFQKENKVYCPHITLAKKWVGPPVEDVRRILAPRFKEERVLIVDEVVIYRIYPKNNPKYEVFASYKLRRQSS